MNRYTNFILTVIAVAMLGILFKGQIIKPAHAWSNSQLAGGLRDLGQNQVNMTKKLDRIEQLIRQNCN